ncbi:hypothetical protein KCU95_g230, partial [Aureobasidium melanogenum]
MELDIAPPPCSGAEMVSSTSSRRTRLDAATTSRLLSAVTPGDSNIVGLGISFDLEPSSTISTKSFNDRSTRNSRSEVQTPEACPKVSTGTSVTSQNNRDGAPTLRTSPPRWPSGVPGLGNTILGPRCPRILTASCPPAISGHNSPNLSTHVPSPTTIPLVAPQSRNSTKTVRTSTKRRASSQPSTGLSAKMARVSVDSVPVNSVPVNSPLVKHDQTDEQCMAPRRCGSRRLGLAEGEKRAMPAILWQVEKEKIEKEMERATTHEGVETLSDGNGSYVGKECSVQEGPQLLNPGMLLGSRAEVFAVSPKVQVGIEYACDTIDDAPQLSIDHEGSYKVRKHPERPIQSSRPERKIAKFDEAGSYKQLSQTSPQPSTNTPSQGHNLPSTIKKSTPTTASSNGNKCVSFAELPNLDRLVHQLLALLDPYIHFHFSCSAMRPLRLIRASLLSSPPTVNTMEAALEDTRELLKVLAGRQTAALKKVEAMEEKLEKVGIESVLKEARDRIKRTDGDVKRLGNWMGECKA